MTQNPYGPDELDRVDPSLDEVAEALERYASGTGGEPPAGLTQRIVAALDNEPEPAPGWWAALVSGLAPWRGAARALAVAAVLVAAVTGGLAIRDLMTQPNLGPSPLPSVNPSPSPTFTPSPSPTPSASPSPTGSPSPSPSESESEAETPDPSESESDDSGGSGGGDNSGPGGGGNSGSGGEDNSGPGSGD